MKIGVKIAIVSVTLVLFMFALPFATIKLAKDLATVGLWVILFFAVNPVISVCLGILAATDLRRLWWVPVATAVLFPPLFGLAISDFVLDLYIYSAFYLVIGVVTMLGTHFFKKLSSKSKK